MRLKEILCRALGCCKKESPSFSWKVSQPINKESKMSLELTITNEQKIKVTLAPVTSTGKTAPLDGVPTWSVVSGAGTIVAASDGLSAYLVSSDDDLSDTLYQVSADADLGAGMETILDSVLVHTEGARAVSLGLAAGTAEPKVLPV